MPKKQSLQRFNSHHQVAVLSFGVMLSTLLFIYSIVQQLGSNTSVYAQEADPTSAIPAGTVVAFDLETCPDGWTRFSAANGRAIIGTSPGAGAISERNRGDIGGSETHLLTVDEMPAHTHQQTIWSTEGGTGWSLGGVYNTQGVVNTTQTTGAAGGDSAHNNMQPFIALLYCVKS